MSCVSRASERLLSFELPPDKAFRTNARLLTLFDDGSPLIFPFTIELRAMVIEVSTIRISIELLIARKSRTYLNAFLQIRATF